MSTEQVLVSYDEARRLLGGIGKSSLFELMDSGKVRRVKVGARGFVTRKSIDEYAESLPALSKS